MTFVIDRLSKSFGEHKVLDGAQFLALQVLQPGGAVFLGVYAKYTILFFCFKFSYYGSHTASHILT